MEVGLVRHAAANANDEDISELKSALRANETAIGDTEAFIRTDVAFHFCFAKMMRNPAFVALHDAMSTWLTQQRQIALAEPGEDRRGYEAPAEIFRRRRRSRRQRSRGRHAPPSGVRLDCFLAPLRRTGP
jgi:GntR family transcriptional repressor for pyruvate dehydrogenase complex